MIDLRPIAEDVVASRPDWSLGAVLSVLAGQRERGSAEDMRRAALAAAGDPDGARTPAAIAFNRYWSTTKAAPKPEGFAGPLPECSTCGQPFRRDTTAAYCPDCGQQLVLRIHHNLPPEAMRAVTCLQCHREQGPGFAHCANCGHAFPTAPVWVSAGPAVRTHLEDPVLIGTVIESEGWNW